MEIGVKMKRNTAELKEKLIETGVEEIRTRGVDQLSIWKELNNGGLDYLRISKQQ